MNAPKLQSRRVMISSTAGMLSSLPFIGSMNVLNFGQNHGAGCACPSCSGHHEAGCSCPSCGTLLSSTQHAAGCSCGECASIRHGLGCTCAGCVSMQHDPGCNCGACSMPSMLPAAYAAEIRDVGADGSRSATTAAQNIQARQTNARLEASGFKLDTLAEEEAKIQANLKNFSYDDVAFVNSKGSNNRAMKIGRK